jgi:hypothetical protein
MPYFRLDGPELRIGPANTPVARHENRQWEHEGHWHTRIRISSPVQIRFENHRSFPLGVVFRELEFRDGYLYAGNGLNLARYDDATGQWFVPLTKRRFPSVVVEAA